MKCYRLLFFFLFLSPVFVAGQDRYDVIIDEIMADPAPSAGLPGNEWVELKNTSHALVNLSNWRIATLSGQSGPLPVFELQPDSFVIVCGGAALAAMSVFGPAIAAGSFPSLDNEQGQLLIKSPGGGIIFAMDYSSSWHQNATKKEGGWSLEMVDTGRPCAGRINWTSSLHPLGGTPGAKNSVDNIIDDHSAPRIVNAYARDSLSIVIVFDRSLDSLSAVTLSNYHIDGGVSLGDCRLDGPLWAGVALKTSSALSRSNIYTITIAGLADCSGQMTGEEREVRVGLPVEAMPGNGVINEVLFNPRPNGSDYVELYNNGTGILDAATLSIANRGGNGAIGSIKVLSAVPAYIFPGEYLVLTEDAAALSRDYLVKNEATVLVVPALPSFPDDAGDVLLLNAQGILVDEVVYDKNWHFKLISDAEGVSLERIDPQAPSQAASNWHSAASTAGYGTPGYKNSQVRERQGITAKLEISPAVFSPDNDGLDDMVRVAYQMDDPGYVANIRIFDAKGTLVRRLVKNDLLSRTGYWNWDGLDDKDQRLPIGIYMIFTEIFNLEGKKQRFKNVVVLARKL